MKSLSDSLLQLIREYGIKEVSMGQYETTCKKIVRFALEHGFSSYYQELKADYNAFIDSKADDKSICYEYGRFQHRVIRMMASWLKLEEQTSPAAIICPESMWFPIIPCPSLKKPLIITY